LDGVSGGGPPFCPDAGGGDDVEKAGAVDMHGEPTSSGRFRGLLHHLDGNHSPTAQVVTVLPDHQTDPWEETDKFHSLVYIVNGDLTTLTVDGPEADPTERLRSTGFD